MLSGEGNAGERLKKHRIWLISKTYFARARAAHWYAGGAENRQMLAIFSGIEF